MPSANNAAKVIADMVPTTTTMDLKLFMVGVPLSRNLAIARERLSGMLNAHELDPVDPDALFELKGLELFLVAAEDIAKELEEKVRPPSKREREWRRPAWVGRFRL